MANPPAHPATLAAAQVYLLTFPVQRHLFLGEEPGTGLATRTINWRVGELGRLAGLEGVSPHDIRHYWGHHIFSGKTYVKP